MTQQEAQVLVDLSNQRTEIDGESRSVYKIHYNSAFTDEIVYVNKITSSNVEENIGNFSISFYNPDCGSKSSNLLDYDFDDFIVSKLMTPEHFRNLVEKVDSLTIVSRINYGVKYRFKNQEKLSKVFDKDEKGNFLKDGKVVVNVRNLGLLCDSIISFDKEKGLLAGWFDTPDVVLPEMLERLDKNYKL